MLSPDRADIIRPEASGPEGKGDNSPDFSGRD
jgi:hypothetical protein